MTTYTKTNGQEITIPQHNADEVFKLTRYPKAGDKLVKTDPSQRVMLTVEEVTTVTVKIRLPDHQIPYEIPRRDWADKAATTLANNASSSSIYGPLRYVFVNSSQVNTADNNTADNNTADNNTADNNTMTTTTTTPETITCPITGDTVPFEESVLYGGTRYAASVLNTHTWIDDRGELVSNDDVVSDVDGTPRHIDDCVEVEDDYYLTYDRRLVYATDVDEYRLRIDCTRWDGDWYSSEWADNNLRDCDDCGATTHLDDIREVRDGDWVCESCANQSGSAIRDSDDRTASRYPAETRDALRFGLEIEMEVCHHGGREDTAEDVLSCLPSDYAILKDDGSLDNGFEFVTRPDSLKVHSRILSSVLHRLPSALRAWDADTCGMHIHVSRAPLTTLQQGKMLVFVNAPENQEFVTKIAGRNSARWAKFIPKKHADASKAPSGDRYQAINITSRTLEFRIFRSSIRRDTVLKGLEFVAALVSFCAPGENGIREAVDVKSFCNHVRKHRKEFPHLDAFLVRRGYLPPHARVDVRKVEAV